MDRGDRVVAAVADLASTVPKTKLLKCLDKATEVMEMILDVVKNRNDASEEYTRAALKKLADFSGANSDTILKSGSLDQKDVLAISFAIAIRLALTRENVEPRHLRHIIEAEFNKMTAEADVRQLYDQVESLDALEPPQDEFWGELCRSEELVSRQAGAAETLLAVRIPLSPSNALEVSAIRLAACLITLYTTKDNIRKLPASIPSKLALQFENSDLQRVMVAIPADEIPVVSLSDCVQYVDNSPDNSNLPARTLCLAYLIKQVFKEMELFHSTGYVIRSMSSSNIRVCPDGRLKFTDLTSVCHFGDTNAPCLQSDATLGLQPPAQTDAAIYQTSIFHTLKSTQNSERFSAIMDILSSLEPDLPQVMYQSMLSWKVNGNKSAVRKFIASVAAFVSRQK